MSVRRSLLAILSVITGVLVAGGTAAAGVGGTPFLAATATSVSVEARVVRDDGESVNGLFDIQFRLYDSESEGDKVGRTVTSSKVPVADGLLVATPDFGPRALGGQARWLEVSIKPSKDGGPFKALTPRLPVTQTAEGAFASGELLYLEARRRDDDGPRHSAAFWALSGNSDIDPSDNFLGTTDAQPLIIKTNNNEVIRITPDGRVGIGTDDPEATLHVVGTLAVGEGTVTVSEDAIRIPVTFPSLLAAGEIVMGNLGPIVPGGTDLGSGMGIFAGGAFGFPAIPLWVVTEKGSFHSVPETFSITDASGQTQRGTVVIGPGGVVVKDNSGNVVFQVNENGVVVGGDTGGDGDGSLHVPLIGGGTLFTDDTGLAIVNNQGEVVFRASETGVFTDSAAIPLADGGVIFANDRGISIANENAVVVWQVNSEKSVHRIPEEFSDLRVVDNEGNIVWQVTTDKSIHNIPEEYRLTDAAGNSVGTLTIGQGGLTVKNNAGTTVFQVNENGVVVGGGGGGGTASALSTTLPGGETLTVDSNGINLMAGVNLLYQLTPQGSVHRVPEVFTSIKVETDPNSTAPKTIIDISPTTGITMFDEQAGAVSGVNPSGQFFSSTPGGSYFADPSTGVNVTSCDNTGCNSFSASPGVGGVQQITNGGNTSAGIGTDGIFSSCDSSTGTDTCLGWGWNGVAFGINDVPIWGIDQAGNFTTSGDVAAQNVTADIMTAGSTNSLIMESFPVLTGFSYTPGTVLVIDASTGKLKPSASAADPAVIGVVAPGATVDANGEILVVVLGARGPVRKDGTRIEVVVNVDTSLTGPIVPGDSLVTSTAQGRAMKRPSTSTDPAAIFGKALEPVAGGQQATIRAFISHW